MEENMIEFMLFKKSGDKFDGLGRHSFLVPPRTGEFVSMDDESGKASFYKVIAIAHPIDGASTAGDIFLELVSQTTDEGGNGEVLFIKKLLNGEL